MPANYLKKRTFARELRRNMTKAVGFVPATAAPQRLPPWRELAGEA